MHRAWNRAYGDAHDALGNSREVKQAATEEHPQLALAVVEVRAEAVAQAGTSI